MSGYNILLSFFTGTEFDVFNHSIRLCQNAHLCGNCHKINYVHENEATACGCDDMCPWFNDCCYDIDMSCVIPNPDKIYFFEHLAEREISRQDITCVTPTRDNVQSQGVWMVSRCPEAMRNTVENRKCQEYGEMDVYETIPVTDKFGFTYKNAYCAICHGASTTDLTSWNIKAHCNAIVTSLLEESVNASDPFQEALKILSQNCSLAYTSPEHVGPLGNRSCVDTIEVSQCVKGVDKSIFDICKQYTAYILDGDDLDNPFEGHRNPHCFQCSHGFLYDVMNCELSIPIVDFHDREQGQRPTAPRGPDVIPISALVNFNPNGFITVIVDKTVITQKVVRCPEGAVFDPFSNQCRLLSCPVGSYLYDQLCIPLAESTGCAMNDLQYGMTVTVNISHFERYKGDSTTLKRYVQTCLTNLLKLNIFEPSLGSIPSDFLALPTVAESKKQGSTIQYNFLINAEEATSIFDIQMVFDSVFKSSFIDTQDNQFCGVLQTTLSQTCLSLTNCSNINTRSEFSFITINDTLYIFANATYRVYHILQQQLYFSYTRQDGNDTGYRKMQLATICDNPLNCPLLTLPVSEFQIINNSTGALLHVPSGMEFQMEEYQMTTTGTIQVCTFLDNTGIINSTDTISFIAYSRPQIIVTLIGYITSIVGEFITFLTYCMFKSLRNRTSLPIMNLVSALFLGQFFLLVGGGRTEPAGLCTAIAIMLHYFFLSTFSWTTVLSYDLYRIFGSNSGPVRVDVSRRLLTRQMMFAWGCPLLVIIPSLIVHFCNCMNLSFRYGSEMACWLNNEYANLLVFGMPLFLSLLFNIFNFCRTVWGIHISKRDKSNRAPTETVRKKKYEELMIYAKVMFVNLCLAVVKALFLMAT